MSKSPRQAAIEGGFTVYDGKPCRKCGGTRRYTLIAACTACHSQATMRNKRREALLLAKNKAEQA
jgi:DnaJ-class molecular chaperone